MIHHELEAVSTDRLPYQELGSFMGIRHGKIDYDTAGSALRAAFAAFESETGFGALRRPVRLMFPYPGVSSVTLGKPPFQPVVSIQDCRAVFRDGTFSEISYAKFLGLANASPTNVSFNHPRARYVIARGFPVPTKVGGAGNGDAEFLAIDVTSGLVDNWIDLPAEYRTQILRRASEIYLKTPGLVPGRGDPRRETRQIAKDLSRAAKDLGDLYCKVDRKKEEINRLTSELQETQQRG